jgi:hypothetical protein
MPDFLLDAKCMVEVVPNAAYQERTKDLDVKPRPKDTDADVLITPFLAYIVPLKTIDQAPAAMIPLPPIRMSLLEAKTHALAIFKAGGHVGAEGLIKFDEHDG